MILDFTLIAGLLLIAATCFGIARWLDTQRESKRPQKMSPQIWYDTEIEERLDALTERVARLEEKK